MQYAWLVIFAFTPQLLVAYLPAFRASLPQGWAAAALLGSQALLLLFCWFNRRVPGIALLAFGLAANLVVMAANSGFMPISPETASRLVPPETLSLLELGARFGRKDILLLPEATNLFFLSDHLLLPKWSPYQVAFSPGDILVGLGAFWLMAAGARSSVHEKRSSC